MIVTFNGPASQKLRWVLLFAIYQSIALLKAFHRPHKILTLLKEQFTIYKKLPQRMLLQKCDIVMPISNTVKIAAHVELYHTAGASALYYIMG